MSKTLKILVSNTNISLLSEVMRVLYKDQLMLIKCTIIIELTVIKKIVSSNFLLLFVTSVVSLESMLS